MASALFCPCALRSVFLSIVLLGTIHVENLENLEKKMASALRCPVDAFCSHISILLGGVLGPGDPAGP